ncbi:MAG: 50S ribosomal protein L1 [Bdellovibrionales bacterium]
MAKAGKRIKKLKENVDKNNRIELASAMDQIVAGANAKFDESIEVSVNLGVDAKQSDQQVRGSCALPHGLGKEVKVLVFAKGPKEAEAKEAGADFVGSDEFVEKIQGGWMDFDKAIATPDMMPVVSRVAKILGPRGLMPNPKVGTVTMDVKKAVEGEKKGKCSYRVDKAGIIHASIGKKSMGSDKLKDNLGALIGALVKSKPATSKGTYLKNVSLSSTMGAGVRIDVSSIPTQ